MELSASRNAIDFGEVAAGDSRDQGIDLVLASGGPAEISAVIEPEGSPFVVVTAPPAAMADQTPAFVEVRFQPGEAGDRVALLVLTASNIQGSSRLDVALEGLAVVGPLDADRDGSTRGTDCDDDEPTVHPGAEEICDGLDNDCDELLPADETDFDGDGWGSCQGDCSDDDPSTHPGAAEICDGLDNDCDGFLEEQDDDWDGFRVCDGDCDDGNPLINPGAGELCDGEDGDCDGVVGEEEDDADFDSWRGCAGDCDDGDPGRFPSAPEGCDGLDTDCDSVVPVAETDGDGDGFIGCAECDDEVATAYPGAVELCDGLDTDCDGTVPTDEVDGDLDGSLACADCDDAAPVTFPGAPEFCDGLDNDCDGSLPADEVDADGDGFRLCADCDDGSAQVHAGADEICDGLDDDCDGILPADEVDADGDGSFACADCDESRAAVHPGAPEICDGLDDDCDTVVPADETDDDGDGRTECSGQDCDDTDAQVHAGAAEDCYDAVDSDCSGAINEGCSCPIWGWKVAMPSCTTYGTYACPWAMAQLAVGAAGSTPSCHEAWLRPDTYYENLTIEGTVLLRGPGGAGDVIIDGNGDRTIEVAAGATVAFAHMTITGGVAGFGGGLLAEDANVSLEDVVVESNACTPGGLGGGAFMDGTILEIEDSVFSGNDCGVGGADAGNDGGGLFLVDSTGTIHDTLFDGNTAGDGAALFLGENGGGVTVSNCGFVDNQAHDSDNPLAEVEGGTLVVDSDHAVVANNLFSGNSTVAGGGAITMADHGAATLIINNVMVGNHSSQGAGIHFEPFSNIGGAAWVQGNVIATNTGWGVWTDVSILPTQYHYNDVYGNTAGGYGTAFGPVLLPVGNIAQDPQFVAFSSDGAWSNDDLHLGPSSPCIDAGNPDPFYLDVDGSPNDMGMYGGPLGGWDGP